MAASLASALLASGCSVVGIRTGTEEPRYQVVETLGRLQIRDYQPRLAAETTVAGDEYSARGTGFRRLAGFIFGGNHSGASIAMTAPVAQSQGATIAMTAPVDQQQLTPGTVANPLFHAIKIHCGDFAAAERPGGPDRDGAGGRPLASTAIPARSTARPWQRRIRSCFGYCKEAGWVAAGPPMTWFYDPPWTLPFLRRNEAVVPVNKPG